MGSRRGVGRGRQVNINHDGGKTKSTSTLGRGNRVDRWEGKPSQRQPPGRGHRVNPRKGNRQLQPRRPASCPARPSPPSPRSFTGDSLSYHNGQKFSTFDRDQDLYVQNCAALSSGAWWFKSCHFSNLNGFYLGGAHLSYANGINWAQWKGFYYSLKKSEMKIRRL